MAKTRSMTRSQNPDDACTRKKIKTCDKVVVASWSDLNHDVLNLVMMRLGVVDFLAFGGVCKSWRSLALPNKNKFMASKPPMLMSISDHTDKEECCLEDFEGRKFKTIVPHLGGRTFVGLTCGYLILSDKTRTHDFWLVNPITRHELHFPLGPYLYPNASTISSLLVFSPSISRWVFVVLPKFSCEIWYCIEGKGGWSRVSSTIPIYDIHAFKGKIYTINKYFHLCEMRFNPCEMRLSLKPNLMLLETKNSSKQGSYFPKFVSLGEKLYVIDTLSMYSYLVYEVDFGKMKWVPFKGAKDEYALFSSIMNGNHILTNKRELWADLWLQYVIYVDIGSGKGKSAKGWFISAKLWYFPNECLSVNILND